MSAPATTTMDPTPAIPAPQLFSLVGQNVLITGATRGVYLFVIYSIFLYFSVFFLSSNLFAATARCFECTRCRSVVSYRRTLALSGRRRAAELVN